MYIITEGSVVNVTARIHRLAAADISALTQSLDSVPVTALMDPPRCERGARSDGQLTLHLIGVQSLDRNVCMRLFK